MDIASLLGFMVQKYKVWIPTTKRILLRIQINTMRRKRRQKEPGNISESQIRPTLKPVLSSELPFICESRQTKKQRNNNNKKTVPTYVPAIFFYSTNIGKVY